MNTETPFFIISASLDVRNASENGYRNQMLERQLRRDGFATAPCKGAYKGVAERSILVIDEHPRTDECFYAVLRLARTYRQESILAVDANRCARLVYCDGTPAESLGKFTCITEELARVSDAYTERAGRYYACIK